MPDYKPPVHTYTPEQFTKLVDECIAQCKKDKDTDNKDGFIACPEQLYMHTKLSPATISAYRNAKEDSSNFPYKVATMKWYNFMGIEGNRDYIDGKGLYGKHINNRVLKYSETQVIEQTSKVVEFTKSVDEMTVNDATEILKDIL